MSQSNFRFFLWLVFVVGDILLASVNSGYCFCHPPIGRREGPKFKQKTKRFWEYAEESNTWVEVSLPFRLMSCINETCTEAGSIENLDKKNSTKMITDSDDAIDRKRTDKVLPLRKRVSLVRMSEASIWVTGQSGSIYERFWNGVKWVIAPHELPTLAGRAVSVFIVNQTILALSEAGLLYQLQLNENTQPIWIEFMLVPAERNTAEENPIPPMQIQSGVVSHDGERLYLWTTDGSLLQIFQFSPLSWDFHGRPPGGDVSVIADAGAVRPGTIFTISSSGDLYEFDKNSKPSWRKHISSEPTKKQISLRSTPGFSVQGLAGTHSTSLFLITKDGFLIERRLQRRKWKWVVHGAPEEYELSAMTPARQTEGNEKSSISLFFTTTTGCILEYQLFKHPGSQTGEWIDHLHPPNAKIAQGVQGVEVQAGRIMFPLDDGRHAEFHLSGFGGQESGPIQQSSLRKKASSKYEWSVVDGPETEGWNAEYCSDDRGPSNCLVGTKDMLEDYQLLDMISTSSTRRWRAEKNEHYFLTNSPEISTAENYNFLTKSITNNFRMRVMHPDRSFFLVTDNGLTFEYLYADNVWIWLRHEYSTPIRGALGNYNGSLFLVDSSGNLLIRERNGNELSWINCSAMKKGRQVATGPPWDTVSGRIRRVSEEEALFFVSKKGRLLQFTVLSRKFEWKNCHSPLDTRIAFIVDQEVFRTNVVFVIGRNSQLYQYNRITELWHRHYQSPHLVLARTPGTAIRPSPFSSAGSIFLISENGGLVEYHWDTVLGWEWVEHGTPHRDVLLVGAPGPSFDGTQLFLVGSDGHVYRRHLEERTWKWTCHGFPSSDTEDQTVDDDDSHDTDETSTRFWNNAHHSDSFIGNCNDKVAPIRPVPFSEYAVIFELQDGRLGELRRSEGAEDWNWARIIGTPTSLCFTTYWTAVAT